MECDGDDKYMTDSVQVVPWQLQHFAVSTSQGAQLGTDILAKVPIQLMVNCTSTSSPVYTLVVCIIHSDF